MFTWGSNASKPDGSPAAPAMPAAPVAAPRPEDAPEAVEEAPRPPARLKFDSSLGDTVPKMPTGKPVGRVRLPEETDSQLSAGFPDPQLPEERPEVEPPDEDADEDVVPVPEADTTPPEEEPPAPPAAAESPAAAPEVYRLLDLLSTMVENGATDLHLHVGNAPIYRIEGRMARVPGPPLTREMARNLLLPLIRPEHLERFKATGQHDFAYELTDSARFRGHFFGQHWGLAAVFHRLPWLAPSLDELLLPDSLKNLCGLSSGLIVAAGPARSGRTTTVAAMVDHINHNRCEHVIILEEPVEYYHESDTCLIDHREIGLHVNSLADGFRAVLHEQPNIVVMGELRNRETLALALKAVEGGMLVFATLGSGLVTMAVERLIDLFPGAENDRVRSQLSISLKAVLAHQLVHTGGNSVLALEIMTSTKDTARLIREGRLAQLKEVMQKGQTEGMQTMDQALAELIAQDRLPRHLARRAASDTGTLPAG